MSLVVTLSEPMRDGSTVSFSAEIVETNQRAQTLAGLTGAVAAAPPFVQWCDTIPAFVKPDPYTP